MNLHHADQPLPHLKEMELAFKRFAVVLRDVVEPMVCPRAVPCEVTAALISDVKADPPAPSTAAALSFAPVNVGWAWGPAWATCWFRVRGVVPAEFAGKPVVLRFSSGTEALVWASSPGEAGGFTPAQGLDVNRDRLELFKRASGGERVDVLIEAACNHPFGTMAFEWDDAEVHRRWTGPTPGRLERAELAVFDPAAWELRQRYAFALGLARELPLNSARAADLYTVLRTATEQIVRGEVSLAAQTLGRGLERPAAACTLIGHAVGHAHLDTAWLWPLRETKRKLLRTFSNQLRLMEQHPAYVFMASQAQHYAWVEERSPALFVQIRERVAQGRWEPNGGMWVEPDLNCISGESIVRQVLHGTRYWREKFGPSVVSSMLYLPDTFGFGAALPQIMHQAGIEAFVTNKLSWNDRNVFPHTTFLWRGLDGTEVLAHQTPGHDYNATNTPKELRRVEVNHKNKDLWSRDDSGVDQPPHFLQPFGFGDGGGGPTDWSIRFAQLSANCDGLPALRLGSAGAFVRHLCSLRDAAAKSEAPPLPVWDGELYLELHRGTLTTQAWIKAANARAERGLRAAELLSVTAGLTPDLDRAWKLLLLNQFHDILPGSSIGWVYEDARAQFAEIEATIVDATQAAMKALAVRVAPGPAALPVLACNPTGAERSGVLEVKGSPAWADRVPAHGVAGSVYAALPPDIAPSTATTHGDEFTLSNGLTTVKVTTSGVIRTPTGVVEPLRLYDDRPIMWDAWDIDGSYEDARLADAVVESVRLASSSPLRSTVEVRGRLGRASTFTQLVELDAGSPVVTLRFRIDWHEDHTLLRLSAGTPAGAGAQCTHGTHFGHLLKPLHGNTSFEQARFEFPVQAWLDVSEPGFGLALLAQDKFGFSARHGEVGVSLLRSPTHPDPAADRGVHEFALGVVSHAGDWRAAGVPGLAERFANPMSVWTVGGARKDAARSSLSAVEVRSLGLAGGCVSCLKPADDGVGAVLRLHECHGASGAVEIRWGLPASQVQAVDVLERPMQVEGLSHDAANAITRVELRPFQILSLRVRG